MSLINRMLEDLEQRDRATSTGRGQLRQRDRRQLLPWVLVGLLLLACLALGWLALQPGKVATGPSLSLAVTPESLEPAKQASNEAGTADREAEREPERAEPVSLAQESPAVAAASRPAATLPASSMETVTEETPAAPEEANVTDPLPEDPVVPGTMRVAPAFVDPQEAAQQQIDAGLRALARGEFEAAARSLRKGLVVLEGHDAAREALYVAYRRQGRLAEAEGVLRDGLAVADRPPVFAKMMARDLLARGDLQQAVAIMSLHDPAVSADPEFHALRGSLLLQSADFAAAAEVYTRLVAFDAGNGPWLAGLGIAREQLGDAAAARRNFEAALEAGGLAASVEKYVRQRISGDTADSGE